MRCGRQPRGSTADFKTTAERYFRVEGMIPKKCSWLFNVSKWANHGDQQRSGQGHTRRSRQGFPEDMERPVNERKSLRAIIIAAGEHHRFGWYVNNVIRSSLDGAARVIMERGTFACGALHRSVWEAFRQVYDVHSPALKVKLEPLDVETDSGRHRNAGYQCYGKCFLGRCICGLSVAISLTSATGVSTAFGEPCQRMR